MRVVLGVTVLLVLAFAALGRMATAAAGVRKGDVYISDPANDRVLVARVKVDKRGTKVKKAKINPKRTIEGLRGPTELAVGKECVFVINSRDNLVSKIDRATDSIVEEIKVGTNLRSLALTPDEKYLLVAYGKRSVAVIATGCDGAGQETVRLSELLSVLRVGKRPWRVRVGRAGNFAVTINLGNKDSISVIDLAAVVAAASGTSNRKAVRTIKRVGNLSGGLDVRFFPGVGTFAYVTFGPSPEAAGAGAVAPGQLRQTGELGVFDVAEIKNNGDISHSFVPSDGPLVDIGVPPPEDFPGSPLAPSYFAWTEVDQGAAAAAFGAVPAFRIKLWDGREAVAVGEGFVSAYYALFLFTPSDGTAKIMVLPPDCPPQPGNAPEGPSCDVAKLLAGARRVRDKLTFVQINDAAAEPGLFTPRPIIGAPLIDYPIVGRAYLDQFEGGLYPGGINAMPPAHLAAGLAAGANIQPINGSVVLMSLGMSNTSDHFREFVRLFNADSKVAENVVAVNAAQYSEPAPAWDDPSDLTYNVADMIIRPNTPDQVQAIWVLQANPYPEVSLPSPNADAYTFRNTLADIARAAKIRYPNLQQMIFSSRIYSCDRLGVNLEERALHPEPFAYESGYSVKWLIEEQVNQEATGVIDPSVGDIRYSNGSAAWLGWGAYIWTDDGNPRSTDGYSMDDRDLADDCTHPGNAPKTTMPKLMDYFKGRGNFPENDVTSQWFLAH